jgi:exonuclease VII small subunit
MPHEKVQSALLSGKYGLAAGESVPIEYQGHIGQAPLERLPGIVAAGGKVATPKQFEEHVLQRDYGDVAHGLEAFGYNALNTAFLDIPSEFVPEDARKTVRNISAANPNAALAGVGVGIVAPIIADVLSEGALTPAIAPEVVEAVRLAKLAGEGEEAVSALGAVASTAGKVLAAPTSLASKVGDLVEVGVKKLVGDQASSLAGKLAQTAIAKGMRAGTETAIYGAADAWGEDNLKDKPELTGEKLWNVVSSDFWQGALLGGGLGVGGLLSREVAGRAIPAIERKANEEAIRAINPSGSLLKGEEKLTAREQSAVRRELIDSGVVKAREKISDITPKVADRTAKAERALYDIYDNPLIEKLHGVDGAELGHIIEKNKGPLNLEDIINKYTSAEEIAKTGGIPFKAAAQIVDDISKQAGKLPASERALSRGLVQDLDSLLEKTLKKQTDKKAVEAYLAGKTPQESLTAMNFFKNLSETLGNARSEAQLWRKLDGAAQETLEKSEKGFLAKLAEHKIAGGIGTAVGIAAGHAGLAVPVAATAIAAKLIKDYGHSTAAVMLDKLGVIGAARRAALSEDARLASKWNVLKEGKIPPRPPTAGDLGKYDLYKRAIEKWETQNGQGKIDVMTATMARHAPRTAQGFSQAALRSFAYLKQNFPTPPPNPSALNPKWDTREPSDLQKTKAARVFEVVVDPVKVASHVLDGTLTKPEVDALKATHPERLLELQLTLTNIIGVMKSPPAPSVQRAMSLLLDKPAVDPTLMTALQGNYASQSPAQGAPGGGKKGGKSSGGVGASRSGKQLNIAPSLLGSAGPGKDLKL